MCAVKAGISCFEYFREKSHEAWTEGGGRLEILKRERKRVESGVYLRLSPLIEWGIKLIMGIKNKINGGLNIFKATDPLPLYEYYFKFGHRSSNRVPSTC